MNLPTATIDGVPDPLPEGLVVLDVRETYEWDAGHLVGALHVPLGELGQRWSELPAGGQVLVVCRVGARSAQATAYLVDQGVEAVNLAGGLHEWETAGRTLVSDTGQPAHVV